MRIFARILNRPQDGTLAFTEFGIENLKELLAGLKP